MPNTMDINTILIKWLKKAKLRNGKWSVAALGTKWAVGQPSQFQYKAVEFYYRGKQIGESLDNGVKLMWPACLEATSPWSHPPEIVLLADPKFFTKLRKAFKTAMAYMDYAFRGLRIPKP